MGIRVHKCLGYGLVDLNYDIHDLFLDDDRINEEGYLGLDWEEKEDKFTREGYLKYIEGIDSPRIFLPELTREITTKENWEPYKSVIYNWEFGEPNVLLIVPPSDKKNWFRHDDTIDWIEETNCYSQANRYQVFNRGIYPYDGYMDRRNGKLLNFSGFISLKRLSKAMKNSYSTKELVELQIAGDRIAKFMEFKDYYDAIDNIIPCIPEEVIYFCKYLKLFNNDETIFELRPMLYVYWA